MFRKVSVIAISSLVLTAIAQPIDFKDMNGRTVHLPHKVERTVTTPMPASAVFTAVNQSVKGLEGMHGSTHKNLPTMLLPALVPGIEDVRHDITRGSSFTPNVESLLEINPDIVWQWGHMGDELLAPIEAAGLRAVALNYGTEAQTQRWIELFATSLGNPERGQQINQWRQNIRAKVEQQVASIPPQKRQTILYLSRYKTGIAAAGLSSNFTEDSSIAGGRNVNDSKASAPTINVEQILIWNPDVIVLTNFEHDLTPQMLYNNPMLSDIHAVRHQRIYKVPAGAYYWDPPSQDSPLYWVWLAKLLYPDTVTLDLRAEIRDAYQMLYGYAVSDAQIDRLLHMEANRSSRHYLRSFATQPAITAQTTVR